MVRTRSNPVKVEAASSTQQDEAKGPEEALVEHLIVKRNGPIDQNLLVVRPMTRWAKEPTKTKPNQTWVELYVSEYYIIPAQRMITMVTNLQSAFIPNCHGVISAKNDTLQKYGLMVHPKVVLPGTMEELTFQVTNITHDTVVIPRHTSLVIFAMMQVATIKMMVLTEESGLPTMERDEPRFSPEPEDEEEMTNGSSSPKRKGPLASRLGNKISN